MNRISGNWVFADFYQFYVHDDEWDMAEEMPEPTNDSETEFDVKGFESTKCWARFATRSTNHAHWLDVYESDTPPAANGCDRMIAVPISILSGILAIHGPTNLENHTKLQIKPG